MGSITIALPADTLWVSFRCAQTPKYFGSKITACFRLTVPTLSGTSLPCDLSTFAKRENNCLSSSVYSVYFATKKLFFLITHIRYLMKLLPIISSSVWPSTTKTGAEALCPYTISTNSHILTGLVLEPPYPTNITSIGFRGSPDKTPASCKRDTTVEIKP